MKKPKKLIADRLLPVRRVASPTPEDLPLATLFAGVEPLDPLPEISAQRIRRRLELELGRSSQSRLPGWFRSAVAAGAALLVLEAAAAATLAAWPAARHRLFGGTGKRGRCECGSRLSPLKRGKCSGDPPPGLPRQRGRRWRKLFRRHTGRCDAAKVEGLGPDTAGTDHGALRRGS